MPSNSETLIRAAKLEWEKDQEAVVCRPTTNAAAAAGHFVAEFERIFC